MDKYILNEVIDCLPKERTLFHYFKGQYAFYLLSCITKKQDKVSAIKKTRYGKLLEQTEVKGLLADLGNGKLDPSLFDHVWHESSKAFVLTVDTWNEPDQDVAQTTRQGSNLVLQLNFSEDHTKALQELVKPEDEFVFNFSGHPVQRNCNGSFFRDTLAWARIDLDLDSDEALIEEIQSDWVRRVHDCRNEIKQGASPWHLSWCECKPEEFVKYADEIMAPYAKLWSEAMLCAAIEFIHKELGIKTIYYHTHEYGRKLKKIGWSNPPRSLYSDLPKKFCFQLTNEDPSFIKNDRGFKRKKRKLKELTWYQLTL